MKNTAEKKNLTGVKSFYRMVLNKLKLSGTPFLLGGALAFEHYTGIKRSTKDIDIFIHPRSLNSVFHLFRSYGFKTELRDGNWLGKIFFKKGFADIIFGSSNGVNKVDDQWFQNAREVAIMGYRIKIVGLEEMIWSKSFVMNRERFDGADIVHLILTQGKNIDWDLLYLRFGQDWLLLYAYLVFFVFVYPSQKKLVSSEILQRLSKAFEKEITDRSIRPRVSKGTLLSLKDYNFDVAKLHFIDSRLRIEGCKKKS